MECKNVIEILIMIATFLSSFVALFIALFADYFRSKLFVPQLKITIKDKMGTINTERKNANPQTDVYTRYFHLDISNLRKKSIAKDVIIILTSIEGTYNNGQNYIWNEEIPLTWVYFDVFKKLENDIGVYEKSCDLISIRENSNVHIHTLYTPNIMVNDFNGAFDFKIKVRAQSNQIVSKEYKYHISWDGIWDIKNSELAKHFIFEECN